MQLVVEMNKNKLEEKIKWVPKGDGWDVLIVDHKKLNFEESLKLIEHEDNKRKYEESRRQSENQFIFNGILAFATVVLTVKTLLDWFNGPRHPILQVVGLIVVIFLVISAIFIIKKVTSTKAWKNKM